MRNHVFMVLDCIMASKLALLASLYPSLKGEYQCLLRNWKGISIYFAMTIIKVNNFFFSNWNGCRRLSSYFKFINSWFIYWYNLCNFCFWIALFWFLLAIFNDWTVINTYVAGELLSSHILYIALNN